MNKLGPISFYKDALKIALPVMLQQFVMSLVSLIDNFMVAGLGDSKMAAVNVANQVNFIYLVILWSLCGAGGIYMAQFRGANDEDGMKQAYRFKALFSLAISAIHFALCWLIPEQMIGLMVGANSAREEIVTEGARFLRIVSFTWFPIAISTAIATAFREIGRPRIPLVISTAATLVNTLVAWLLIYGNLGAPRLEVAGAAIATIIARVLEVVAYVLWARHSKVAFYVPFSRLFNIRISLFSQILTRSGMMLLSETTWVVSESVITALYNGRGGAEVVAGMAAGWTIANIFFLVFGGIHTATAVIVGGSLGAGRLDEARQKAVWVKSGALIMGCFVALGAVASTLLIPVVFGNLTPAARVVTRGLIFVIALYMPVWTLLNAQFAISRSGGDTALGMYVDVSVNTLVFIPGAFILAFLTPLGPVPMFAIIKTTDFLKYVIARWWLKKERWVKNLTAESAPQA